MKSVSILLLCLALCTCLAANAQHKKSGKKTGTKKGASKTSSREKKVSGAQFRFKDGDTFSFGKVKSGPDVFHEFSFINTGDQPLILQDVKAGCSCITLEWPKRPISPGGKGSIKVGYHTSKTGPFNKEVYVYSNAVLQPGQKMYTIDVKGSVVVE
jgi:hypothetical protein